MLFQIGALVFVAVTVAVLLYGMSVFREWQNRSDTRAAVGQPSTTLEGANVTIAGG